MAKLSPGCLHNFPAAMLGEQSSILGSVNLRKTSRRISEAWENAKTQNLEVSSLPISYDITIS